MGEELARLRRLLDRGCGAGQRHANRDFDRTLTQLERLQPSGFARDNLGHLHSM